MIELARVQAYILRIPAVAESVCCLLKVIDMVNNMSVAGVRIPAMSLVRI